MWPGFVYHARSDPPGLPRMAFKRPCVWLLTDHGAADHVPGGLSWLADVAGGLPWGGRPCTRRLTMGQRIRRLTMGQQTCTRLLVSRSGLDFPMELSCLRVPPFSFTPSMNPHALLNRHCSAASTGWRQCWGRAGCMWLTSSTASTSCSRRPSQLQSTTR